MDLMARRRMMAAASIKEDRYLTFTAVEANSTVAMVSMTTGAPIVSLEYSVDGGGSWSPFVVDSTVVTLTNVGDTVKLRGNNTKISTRINNSVEYNSFSLTGSINCSGDVTSLLNNIGGDVALTEAACFAYLFANNSASYVLNTAPCLPSTVLSEYCYCYMFTRNISLIEPPTLPATRLAAYCYYYIFQGSSLSNGAPNLPAEEIYNFSYRQMYYQCRFKDGGYVKATLGLDMSNSCSYMFQACSSMEKVHIASIGTASANMFYGCSSCETLIMDATTPGTITSTTLTGLKSDCKIYVPYSADHSILNAYKAKQYWSDRANYIFELDENGNIPTE